ncbi:hypothetical protein [Veronia pacifica]|uniref:Uncharacterized protein n=1 Tax=Veronia pacifica TaxID=1080227 RepID=A0A1C3EEA3_9GAMM|nr:hypothetical protein [Veronia pacifica]ODA31587.1 hypothetical protein A8L45_16410 [Veronia pacifica]
MSLVLQALSDNLQVEVWEAASSAPSWQRANILAAAYLPDGRVSSLAHWTLAGRDHLLLLAYQHQFGDAISVESRCCHCNSKNQLNFGASQLLAMASPELSAAWDHRSQTLNTGAYVSRFTEINIEGMACQFRLPTVGDVSAMGDDRFTAADSDSHHLFRFAEQVVEPDNFRQLRQAFAERADSELAWMSLFESLEAGILASEPLSVISIEASCNECGTITSHQFDIASQFWAQLSADVERQLWDVHLLASKYGWSSQDILSMSPARRRRHIAMIIE